MDFTFFNAMNKKCKRAMVGSSQEIWCSNQETGRFHEKLEDSWENRESWQVCNSSLVGVLITISDVTDIFAA